MPLEIDSVTTLRQPVGTTFTPSSPLGVSAVGILLSVGALKEATALQTAYAAGKVRLFNANQFVLGPNTTQATLVANECTFSGYPAGGVETTTWNPAMNNGSGAQTVAPLAAFAFTPPETGDPVPGTVGGWWFEDTAAVPRLAGVFAEAITVQELGDAVQVLVSDTLTTAPGS